MHSSNSRRHEYPHASSPHVSTSSTSDSPASSQADRFMRRPEVQRVTTLSRSSLYRLIAVGDFPAPIKLGERASAWSAAEVDSWITARIAERDSRAAA